MRFERFRDLQKEQVSEAKRRLVPNVKPECKVRTPWTEEEEMRLWELYKRRYALKGIASILGRTKGSVDSKIREIKLRKQQQKAI